MRREGGYGNVLGVVMRDPKTARGFHDNLDVCKGSSFGTNFTLAIPHVQLASGATGTRTSATSTACRGMSSGSAWGLEDAGEIVGNIRSALEEAEKGGRGKRSMTRQSYGIENPESSREAGGAVYIVDAWGADIREKDLLFGGDITLIVAGAVLTAWRTTSSVSYTRQELTVLFSIKGFRVA